LRTLLVKKIILEKNAKRNEEWFQTIAKMTVTREDAMIKAQKNQEVSL
jgi:hypothetical protein